MILILKILYRNQTRNLSLQISPRHYQPHSKQSHVFGLPFNQQCSAYWKGELSKRRHAKAHTWHRHTHSWPFTNPYVHTCYKLQLQPAEMCIIIRKQAYATLHIEAYTTVRIRRKHGCKKGHLLCAILLRRVEPASSLWLAVAVAVRRDAVRLVCDFDAVARDRLLAGARRTVVRRLSMTVRRQQERADDGVKLSVDKNERRLVNWRRDSIPAAVERIRNSRTHHVVQIHQWQLYTHTHTQCYIIIPAIL